MNRDLQSLRRDYQFDDLTEEKAGQDPLQIKFASRTTHIIY